MERIAAAAIKYRIKGERDFKYVHGMNHANCLDALSCMELCEDKRDIDAEEQGFMTNQKKFVNRKEAAKIAKKANQVRKNYDREELLSQDVDWYEK